MKTSCSTLYAMLQLWAMKTCQKIWVPTKQVWYRCKSHTNSGYNKASLTRRNAIEGFRIHSHQFFKKLSCKETLSLSPNSGLCYSPFVSDSWVLTLLLKVEALLALPLVNLSFSCSCWLGYLSEVLTLFFPTVFPQK